MSHCNLMNSFCNIYSRILLLWTGNQSEQRDFAPTYDVDSGIGGGGAEKRGSVASSTGASDVSPHQELTESMSDKKDSLLTQSTDNLGNFQEIDSPT